LSRAQNFPGKSTILPDNNGESCYTEPISTRYCQFTVVYWLSTTREAKKLRLEGNNPEHFHASEIGEKLVFPKSVQSIWNAGQRPHTVDLRLGFIKVRSFIVFNSLEVQNITS